MKTLFTLLTAFTILAACTDSSPAKTTASATYTIDPQRITVSGVSSGAYMAGQMHVAHSALFSGAGIMAGGPWWCAQGSMKKALGPCMNGGDFGMAELLDAANADAQAGKIDALENIKNDKVWILHGAQDEVVNPAVTQAAQTFYEDFIAPDAIQQVTDVEVTHGFPTVNTGVACDTIAAPFLNACDYDAAGAILEFLSGPLQAATAATGELIPVTQPMAGEAELLDQALLYVPAACANGASCGLHIAFHGCRQSSEFVGDAFAVGAGYNEWAESNRLLVLYPQVASSKVMPLNPNGCWDWWGYTNEDYANQHGPQISAVRQLMDQLAGRPL